MGKRIHIGTSGWSYKHWRGQFYPHGLASTKWLAYYAGFFETTEINTSFYHLPAADTVKKWMQQVPPYFIFCPKISRFLTHMKKLRDPEEPLERFFSIFAPMKKMMGPVLIQLPPFLKFNFEVAAHFYAVLRKRYRTYSFVMEARHDTWLGKDSLELMTKYEIGWVIAQSGVEFPYAEQVTAKNIYVRFHGPGALYASSYSDEQLHSFALKFDNWERQGHAIWAFFNNDIHGYATGDARRLMEWVKR
jgi:uncharacterized protein YecE (DUF72 family)